jgi:menaquinol-cytochrome c reductase iron-sulfur subunit
VFTRRQALKALISGIDVLIAGTLAVPVFGYLLTPLLRKAGAAAWIALGPAADFRGPEPRRVDFRYTSEVGYTAESVSGFAYVVPGEGPTPVVLSPVCTHMGCNVVWNGEQQRFLCPCHGGQYTADGRNVAGPPPRPLDRLPAHIENGVLMIQAGEER